MIMIWMLPHVSEVFVAILIRQVNIILNIVDSNNAGRIVNIEQPFNVATHHHVAERERDCFLCRAMAQNNWRVAKLGSNASVYPYGFLYFFIHSSPASYSWHFSKQIATLTTGEIRTSPCFTLMISKSQLHRRW